MGRIQGFPSRGSPLRSAPIARYIAATTSSAGPNWRSERRTAAARLFASSNEARASCGVGDESVMQSNLAHILSILASTCHIGLSVELGHLAELLLALLR